MKVTTAIPGDTPTAHVPALTAVGTPEEAKECSGFGHPNESAWPSTSWQRTPPCVSILSAR